MGVLLMIKLIFGDCLEKMKDIPDNSIDMVLTDPPYGTTACKWDTVINLELMWKELNRITKNSAAIILTSSQPFTTKLISSNYEMFKYCWVWEKDAAANFMNFKYQPAKKHEDIVVFGRMATSFSKKGNMTYFPQMETGKAYTQKSGSQKTDNHNPSVRSKIKQTTTINSGERYPSSIQKFKRDKEKIHPTQKPVALMEYLINTYTKKGDLVLDFTMGSGSTGVAAVNLKRKFIGIENNINYFNAAKARVFKKTKQKEMF